MNNDESSSFNGHQYAASNGERKAVFLSDRTPNETKSFRTGARSAAGAPRFGED
jgi:hypothetical protein